MPMSTPTPMPTPMSMPMPMPMLFEIFTFTAVPMFKSEWSSKAYTSNIITIKSQFNWS